MPKAAVDEGALEFRVDPPDAHLPASASRGDVSATDTTVAAARPEDRPRFDPSVAARRFVTLVESELAHGRAFLFAPVFLGLGSVLWFSAYETPRPAIYQTCLFVSLVLAVLLRHRSRVLAFSAAAAALVAAGMWLAAGETARKATVILDGPVTVDLTGRVVSREAVTGGGWRYTVDVVSTERPVLKRPPERVALIARGPHEAFADGQGIVGRARLSPPSGPAMPGLTDFAFSSYFQEIGAIGFFYGAPRPAVLPEAAAKGLLASAYAWIGHLRIVIGERIRSIIPGDAGAFATAMVTDERRAMTRETAEALRLSGLAHIIAISGLNMALSAGIFFVGFRMLLSLHQGLAQAVPIKKLAAVGALAGVTAYYLLSGSAVSAERAWLMMSIMLIAVLIGRPSISIRNVAISALVILVMAPSDVMGASFQMSFAATAALVAGYALFRERKEDDRQISALPSVAFVTKSWRFFWGIALTSIIGGVSTAIFSVAHFQQLAVWGLPANLAAMPVVSFIVMPAGLIAMLLMPFGLDAWPLRVMGFGLDLVIDIAREISSWGGEGASGLLPPFVFPLVVTGFLLLVILKTELRFIGAALIAATFAATFLVEDRSPPSIVISESGDLVGIVGANTVATNRENPPSFIFSQWRRALDGPDHIKPVMMPDGAGKRAESQPRRRELTAEEAEAARHAMAGALAAGEAGRFTCLKRLWCIARYGETMTDDIKIAVVEDAAFVESACMSADIIVTPVRLRRSACPFNPVSTGNGDALIDPVVRGAADDSLTGAGVANRPRLFTGVSLARHGSIAIRFENGFQGRAKIETARNGSERPWNLHRLYDWRSDRFLDDAEASMSLDISDSGE
ncbi:ComEC family competence protein [Rhizobiaceae bacterium BDR2-2]|uniref:ComEC family competence protein n=1 Tax=Ectorhizobium quercum TaxID=2965071 RepID=A0AAE3N0M0_9HYPH|nr:ComEC/Rec2 family competence protein [Ectorhizobium quercum]MCX8997696.1 ComEC family competence protein [Ectorhizobium quercum]